MALTKVKINLGTEGNLSGSRSIIQSTKTLVSGSAQLASRISGSFTAASSSFSTRITAATSSISALKTDSGSFSTRITTNTSTGSILAGTGNIQGVGTTNSPTFVNVTATGTVTAQEFHTEFVSASIVYRSGSTKFGDTIDDTHSFTGSIHQSGSFNLNDGNMTIADTLTAGTVDINAGTVDAITSLTVANDVDVGNYKITSKALEASDLTAGRVTFAGANGLLADDSDLTFSTATLTATNITGTTIKDFTTISGSSTSTGSFARVHVGTSAATLPVGKAILDVRGAGSNSTVDEASLLNLKQETSSTTANLRFNTATGNAAGHIIFSADGFQLRTDANNYTTFADSGHVGIGTTSPDTVNNTLHLYSLTSGHDAGIVLERSGYGKGTIRYSGGPSEGFTLESTTDKAPIRFKVSGSGSSTVAMFISASGNVGIGTTSPDVKLHIINSLSSASIGPFINIGNDWSSNPTYGTTYTSAVIGADQTRTYGGYLELQSQFHSEVESRYSTIQARSDYPDSQVTASLAINPNGGNVGIGITSPVSTLHVYENSTATDSTAGITIENAGTGDSIIQFLETGTQRWVVGLDNSDSDKFKISSDGDLNTNARLTIDTSGNATFTSGGDTNMYISDSVIDMYSPVAMNSNRLALGAGSAAAPSLTFQPGPDYDTGMYRTQADHIGFTTGGANALTLDSSQKATFAGDVTINGDTIVKSITANGDASTAASANGFSADDWVSIGSMGGAGGHRAKFLFYWNSLTVGSCCHHGYAILECGNMYNGSYNYGYDQYIRLLAQTHHNSFGIKGARLRRDGTTLYLQVQISGAPSAGSFTSYLLEKWGTATQVTPAADAYSGTITQTIAFPTTAEYADVSGYANNNGDRYFNGTISYNAASEYTPYPLTLDIAKDAILSHSKLPDGEYKVDDKEHQLDHSKLHDYLKVVGEYDMVPVTEDTKTLADQGIYETPEQEKIVTRWGRDSGATISCLVEVVKDLMAKVEALENA